MQLTESYEDQFPADILERYDFAETRNAAAIMSMTSPEALQDLVELLDGFWLTTDKLLSPGKNKHPVARELDETLRVKGWREARFDQELTTKLTIFPWKGSGGPQATLVRTTTAEYGGHKVDNVLQRAVVDVEWNPKDGNLDRDFGNYVTLYDSGVIDVGVILTRVGGDFRHMVRDMIEAAKAVEVDPDLTVWHKRMKDLADDPYGTSTTSNMGKLVPRLERGDGRGCPILAIAITERCYVPPERSLEEEVRRLAELTRDTDVHPDEPIEN